MKRQFKITLALLLLLVCSGFTFAQSLPNLIPFKNQDLYGYCDSNLNVIIEAKYDRADAFIEDRALVVKENLKGFIDAEGNEVIPCIYYSANPFNQGVSQVRTSSGESKFINTDGEEVSNPMHNLSIATARAPKKNRFGPIKEGRYFYRTNKGIEGYVTIDDDTISASEFKYPYYSESYSTTDDYDKKFRHFYQSRAIVLGENGQGYIDLNGSLVIDTVFDVAFNFKEGRAKVKLDGKYGFIDEQGQIIGEIKYDQVCYFYDGMAQVVIGEKCGYINLDGEEIIPLVYDFWRGERFSSFENGLVRVRINEKFGVLDKNGDEITAVKYDDISSFNNKRASIKLDDKMGGIDTEGNEVIPPAYDYLQRLDNFAFMVQKDRDEKKYGLINIDGKILLSDSVNRPKSFNKAGLYGVSPNLRDYMFIDKYGTKYVME